VEFTCNGKIAASLRRSILPFVFGEARIEIAPENTIIFTRDQATEIEQELEERLALRDHFELAT